MNQYIITEENVRWVEKYYNAGSRIEIFRIRKYNPQAEREKVLDIIDNLYYVSTPHGFIIFYGRIAEGNRILEIDFDTQGIICMKGSELRQGGKQEAPG